MLVGSCPGNPPPGDGPWAESPGRSARYDRPHFRHELVGALMLAHPDCPLLDGVAEPDLVAYLVAAHHGKVRVSVRSLGEEAAHRPPRILGVEDGDRVPAVRLPGGATVPPLRLDLAMLLFGEHDGRPSWTARALALRDRGDLGPFRLGFLEALVRVADWRASAAEKTSAAERHGAAEHEEAS